VLSLTCWSLLGQGERCDVDSRFCSPSATLTTYWEALRSDDAGTVVQCFADPRLAVPYPGMLWFLPPSESVSVYSVLATYELRYRPVGQREDMMAVTGTELVHVHGEWKLSRPAPDLGLPEWRPVPQRVDI
jgi:hypothetical protein